MVYYPIYLTAGYLTGDMPGNPAANQQITSNKIDVIQDEPLLSNTFPLFDRVFHPLTHVAIYSFKHSCIKYTPKFQY